MYLLGLYGKSPAALLWRPTLLELCPTLCSFGNTLRSGPDIMLALPLLGFYSNSHYWLKCALLIKHFLSPTIISSNRLSSLLEQVSSRSLSNCDHLWWSLMFESDSWVLLDVRIKTWNTEKITRCVPRSLSMHLFNNIGRSEKTSLASKKKSKVDALVVIQGIFQDLSQQIIVQAPILSKDSLENRTEAKAKTHYSEILSYHNAAFSSCSVKLLDFEKVSLMSLSVPLLENAHQIKRSPLKTGKELSELSEMYWCFHLQASRNQGTWQHHKSLQLGTLTKIQNLNLILYFISEYRNGLMLQVHLWQKL